MLGVQSFDEWMCVRACMCLCDLVETSVKETAIETNKMYTYVYVCVCMLVFFIYVLYAHSHSLENAVNFLFDGNCIRKRHQREHHNYVFYSLIVMAVSRMSGTHWTIAASTISSSNRKQWFRFWWHACTFHFILLCCFFLSKIFQQFFQATVFQQQQLLFAH